VTLSNSPLGAKTEEVVATSTAASHNDDDVTTVTSFRPHTRSHTAAAHGGGEAGHTDTAQPDLSALLPSDDAMVYGGEIITHLGTACWSAVVCICMAHRPLATSRTRR
jgi:hypothetical protein